MEAEIIRMAAGQGIFAVLFVALLFYVLRHNEKREERLMYWLENMREDFQGVKGDINGIKGCVVEIKNDIEVLRNT